MAKVFIFTPLDPRPGVDRETLIQWVEGFIALGARVGRKGHLLEGDRGEKAGQYAVLWELDSVEIRDRYEPTHGQLSEDAKLALSGADADAVFAKQKALFASWPSTHYVELGE
jgi:hypothetical protein